ncbi:unnamed protein product [Mytilus coruscus]|uniref:Endonuclease/exonuclease/phosphatase domain-containing protein n=1 Tax=Mytilus coruscus TaxID=42192 RepID=A0A6J8CDW7_MYTCO|nr:unnamed protein product [Mytilus coruscus]
MKSELINISKAMKSSTSEVNKIDKKLTSSVSDLRNECGKLKESILDIQMKSTSNNFIFYNIPEAETGVCSEVIQRFCADTMKIENTERIHIIDAHRLGKKNLKIRPVFAKFQCYDHREVNRRKELLPLMKELRDKGTKAYFVKDKIYVGGKEYNQPKRLPREQTQSLKCLSWNVNGLESCHDDNEFLDIVCKYDIFFLCESWLKDNDLIEIDGFAKVSCVNRKQNIGVRSEGETDNLDRLIYGVESDDIPSNFKRRSMDKVTNVFGRKLLQMCYNTGLTIANGRLGDDGDGKFTFCSSKGQSVNDYVLVFPENYTQTSTFCNLMHFPTMHRFL